MKKILLVGDYCQDKFIYGDVNRLSPDAPVPILENIVIETNPGMAGNVERNLKKYCQEPEHIIISEMNYWDKIVKTRYVDRSRNHMFLRVDEGDTILQPCKLDSFIIKQIPDFDTIVISDYCKGYITKEFIEMLCNENENVILETKKRLGDYCAKAKFIKMNELEYDNIKSFLHPKFNWDKKLIITLGDKGCIYNNKIYPTNKVEVYDLCGAGDTFLAAFTSKFIISNDVEQSISFANTEATESVKHRGVSFKY